MSENIALAAAQSAAASASSAATSAEYAATIIAEPNDAAVSTLVNTPASDTAVALAATIAPVKVGNFVLAGAGGHTNNTFGIGGNGASIRNTVRLPVTTQRWRLRIRNYNVRDDLAVTGQVDFSGVWVGKVANTAASWDGNFAAAPTQALAAFSVADLGAEHVTGWVTAPAAQITANELTQIAYGYTGITAAQVVRGFGGIFYTSDKNQADDTTPTAMTGAENSIFDVVLEYEAQTTAPRVLVIGDSLTVGRRIGGDPGLGMMSSWPASWGLRSNALVTNAALSGSTFDAWWSPTLWKFARWGGIEWDAVIVALGTNNIDNGDTLASIKAKFNTTVQAARTATGCQRVYACTIPPRTYTTDNTGKQVIRNDFNKWVEALPYGIAGAFRIDQPVANPANTNALDPAVDIGDFTHMNTLGSMRMANAVPTIAPIRRTD